MAGHECAVTVEVVQKRQWKRIPRKAHRLAVAGHRHLDPRPGRIGIRGAVPELAGVPEFPLWPAPKGPLAKIREVHLHDGVANVGRCEPFAAAPVEEIRKAAPETGRVVDQVPQARPVRGEVAAQGRAGGRPVALENEADIAADVAPPTLEDALGQRRGRRNPAACRRERGFGLQGPAADPDEAPDAGGEVTGPGRGKLRVRLDAHEKAFESQGGCNLLGHGLTPCVN